jgi:hypothetical protein
MILKTHALIKDDWLAKQSEKQMTTFIIKMSNYDIARYVYNYPILQGNI